MTIQKHGYHVKNKLVALQFIGKFPFSFYDNFVPRYQRNSWAVGNVYLRRNLRRVGADFTSETFVLLIVTATFLICI